MAHVAQVGVAWTQVGQTQERTHMQAGAGTWAHNAQDRAHTQVQAQARTRDD